MKIGFLKNNEPERVPRDFLWITAMDGVVKNPLFDAYFDNANSLIRGCVHHPAKSAGKSVHHNVDEFMNLIAQKGKNNWDANPIIVNIYDVKEDARLDLNDLLTYGQRFRDEAQPKYKPILRMHPATWGTWMKDPAAKPLAWKLLEVFELMALQPFWKRPQLFEGPSGAFYPRWLEYNEWWKIAFDETGQWAEGVDLGTAPAQPPATPPVIPPAPQLTDATYFIDAEIEIPGFWRTRKGKIKGVITTKKESENE